MLLKLTANVLGLCDVGAFIERQTNQQQMPFFEKQMYNTLFVRPNIAKPMLYAGLFANKLMEFVFGPFEISVEKPLSKCKVN